MATAARPDPEEFARRLLDGHFLALDTRGVVMLCGHELAGAFRWPERPAFDTLVASADRESQAQRIAALLGAEVAGYAGTLTLRAADAAELRVELLALPIRSHGRADWDALAADLTAGTADPGRTRALVAAALAGDPEPSPTAGVILALGLELDRRRAEHAASLALIDRLAAVARPASAPAPARIPAGVYLDLVPPPAQASDPPLLRRLPVGSDDDVPANPELAAELHELARAVDARNPYTVGHRQRVAHNIGILAESLGLPAARVDALRHAALLHDVGKGPLRPALTASDEALNLEQQEELARHSELGRDLLLRAGMPELAHWVCHLHERHDGSGRPSGLARGDIPHESRLLAVVDAFDHMTRPRAFRRRRPLAEALAELRYCAHTRLDPLAVERVTVLAEEGRLEVAADRRARLRRSLADGIRAR